MMKYLVVLLVVVAVLWLIGMPRRRLDRQAGDAAERARQPAPPPASLPDSIVACPQCGLHLPLAEAVPGRGGYFCCETHRSIHERAHPVA